MAEIIQLPARNAVPTALCYVRVTNPDHHGFVEFQFSIGDPAIYLEMTLPPAAFAEFCATHRARHLDAGEAAVVDATQARWRYGVEDSGENDEH